MLVRRLLAVIMMSLLGIKFSVGEISTGLAVEPVSETDRQPPTGELGRVVRLGEEIVRATGTHPLSKMFVGNSLTCSSCHLDAGRDPQAATFIGVAAAYPAWSPREERVITLEDRVANCFMRSMNGTRPEIGGELSVAVAAYITWLSTGERIAMNASAPLGPRHMQPLKLDVKDADGERGRLAYADKCASCHGDNGLGSQDGPPVWGELSFNAGAGLAHLDKLSAWLKVAMPLDDATLSEQEALDIAAFITSKPRPPFVLEEHLPKPRPQ